MYLGIFSVSLRFQLNPKLSDFFLAICTFKKMKIGLIYQASGLGDILFLQKIAYLMSVKGYQVYWPVVHEFAWLNNYIPQFKFITLRDEQSLSTPSPLAGETEFPFKELYKRDTQSFISDDIFYFSGFVQADLEMRAKYDSIGLDFSDWRDYILFNRNIEKEKKLFYEVLGLSDGEEYVFVNRTFCTRPDVYFYKHISVDPSHYGCRVVELKIVPGFSLFDWCMVLENARQINMIETSFNYLMESPQMFEKMKTKDLTLHSRWEDFRGVDYLFNLPWKYSKKDSS
jgi:hypothetical protein